MNAWASPWYPVFPQFFAFLLFNSKHKTQNSPFFTQSTVLLDFVQFVNNVPQVIGFTVKEKQARYGKQGNPKNEGNA